MGRSNRVSAHSPTQHRGYNAHVVVPRGSGAGGQSAAVCTVLIGFDGRAQELTSASSLKLGPPVQFTYQSFLTNNTQATPWSLVGPSHARARVVHPPTKRSADIHPPISARIQRNNTQARQTLNRPEHDAAENARPPTPMTDQTKLISPLINIRIEAKLGTPFPIYLLICLDCLDPRFP